MSWLFAAVQKLLQISIFFLRSCRSCSSLFVWVGVLLVYWRPSQHPKGSHNWIVLYCRGSSLEEVDDEDALVDLAGVQVLGVETVTAH